jgi:hypothetical protein
LRKDCRSNWQGNVRRGHMAPLTWPRSIPSHPSVETFAPDREIGGRPRAMARIGVGCRAMRHCSVAMNSLVETTRGHRESPRSDLDVRTSSTPGTKKYKASRNDPIAVASAGLSARRMSLGSEGLYMMATRCPSNKGPAQTSASIL